MLLKLIYVSDFRNTLRQKVANYAHGSPQREMLYAVMDWLDKEPKADAEPVRHAKWEEYPDRAHIRCACCRVEFEKKKMPMNRAYCPNCGAKMDQEGNE